MQNQLGASALTLPLMACILQSITLYMQTLLQMAHAGRTLCKQELSQALFPCLAAFVLTCYEDIQILRSSLQHNALASALYILSGRAHVADPRLPNEHWQVADGTWL